MAGFSVVLASSVMQKVRLEIFCLALMGPKKKKKKKKKNVLAHKHKPVKVAEWRIPRTRRLIG
jgi:hypothetical protein